MADQTRAHAEPLHLVIDDVAAGKEVKSDRGMSIRGVSPSSVVIWCLYSTGCFVFALQILFSPATSPFFAQRFLLASMCAGLGLSNLILSAIAIRRIKALIIPTDFTVSEDGILYARRAAPAIVAVPWKRVRSVKKVAGGFIVVVSPRYMQGMIFVPKPADESLARAMGRARSPAPPNSAPAPVPARFDRP